MVMAKEEIEIVKILDITGFYKYQYIYHYQYYHTYMYI